MMTSRQVSPHLLPPWKRYIAIGDSFTEGLIDPRDTQRSDSPMLGWADRLAFELSRRRMLAGASSLSYANLAVRGRLIHSIRTQQFPEALALRPDLLSIVAGGNDLLRPFASPDAIAEQLESMVVRAISAGADVLLCTSVDPLGSPFLQRTRSHVATLNAHIWSIARRRGCFVVDQWGLRSLKQVRMWADDRLHPSSDGHRVIADAALVALGVPPTNPHYAAPPSQRERYTVEQTIHWSRHHFAPWLLRRLKHQSSGDGRHAKRARPVQIDALSKTLSQAMQESAQ
ncbi:MAG: SGNH/GDSL hydrolase family protein [Actinomycetaceae bacterium]|nr:SGNH/GDSL hydrolase family protein [Actinomycetaceae bacterium]